MKAMGFELNPYDTCVANKMVDGKQCTIAWFVDDNKISHVDPKVVTGVIEKIEERFGEMTVTRGKEHVFLGMHITYLDNGTAEIRMSDYVRECIEELGESVAHSATSPAKRDLYDIHEKSPPLDKAQAEVFHSVTAKTLYVSHRGRLDVQLPIAFLCTRVSKSTEQDWTKLKRVLSYMNGTIDDFRVIGADDLTKMVTYVDASYAVHEDMKSHTGGLVSFGTGAVMSKSSKQKLNTKSSTESELVGGSDYLPHPIWAKKFMEKQGHVLTENKFYQDNQSTIHFEKNGRRSCGPNSRHIDIRYFFIKDRLELEDFDVVYCPTEQMLADFFTKPLQGNLFRRLREVVMGRKHTDSLKDFASASSQERVGEAINITSKSESKSGAEADAHSTDGRVVRFEEGKPNGYTLVEKHEPATVRTYAQIVTKRSDLEQLERSRVESVRSEIVAPLTLKK